VSATIAPFFREPIPSWGLDDVFAEWAASRPPPESPWYEALLREWEPRIMLSAYDASPERRPDWFRRDGKSYVVDFVFCVGPGCACTAIASSSSRICFSTGARAAATRVRASTSSVRGR
jgi:hypothetical protein